MICGNPKTGRSVIVLLLVLMVAAIVATAVLAPRHSDGPMEPVPMHPSTWIYGTH